MSIPPQVPNDILVEIYKQLGDMRADVAATKTASENNSQRLEELSGRLILLGEEVKTLSKKEAAGAVKWSVLSFVCATLAASGINLALGKEIPDMTALPPTKYALAGLLWDDDNSDNNQ